MAHRDAPPPIVLVTRLLARTAFAFAARRAAPLFSGIAIAGALLFSPNGMEARDVTHVAARLPSLRLALWAAWLIAATPLARALLGAPGLSVLRSLPLPRWVLLAPLGAFLLALQAPFALLWGRGEGLISALASALTAAAGEVWILARPRRLLPGLVAAAVALLILVGAPAKIAAIAAIPALGLGLGRAFEEARVGTSSSGGAPAWLFPRWLRSAALGGSHLLGLLRVELSLLLRGAGLAALFGVLVAVGARNTGRREPEALTVFALVVSALPLTIAGSSVSAAVQRAEARIRWVLDAAGLPVAPRVVAAMGASGLVGALLGIGLAMSAFCVSAQTPLAPTPVSAAGVTLLLAVHGGALAAMGSLVARRDERRGEKRGERGLVEILIVFGLALAAPLGLGRLGPIALAAIAMILAVPASHRAAPPSSGATGATKAAVGSGDEAEALVVSGLRKRYGGVFAIDDVSFRFPGPGVLVIGGENGAGKSTLLTLVAGVASPDEGTLTVAGHDLAKARERALAHVGYAPAVLDLPDHLTARELVSLVAALRRARPPEPALVARLGVAPFFGQRLGALSLGQRRRACLLAALVGDPRLLVLDEPTNGLDAEGVAMLVDLLQERTARGQAALLATHEPAFREEVESASILLVRGRVA